MTTLAGSGGTHEEKVSRAKRKACEHWKRMNQDPFCGEKPTSEYCPLCELFSDKGCKDCPVAEKVHAVECKNTPYAEAMKVWFELVANPTPELLARWTELSQAEIDLLESLI